MCILNIIFIVTSQVVASPVKYKFVLTVSVASDAEVLERREESASSGIAIVFKNYQITREIMLAQSQLDVLVRPMVYLHIENINLYREYKKTLL